LAGGVPLQDVQDAAGHADPRTRPLFARVGFDDGSVTRADEHNAGDVEGLAEDVRVLNGALS
jgi:hypothetical protein